MERRGVRRAGSSRVSRFPQVSKKSRVATVSDLETISLYGEATRRPREYLRALSIVPNASHSVKIRLGISFRIDSLCLQGAEGEWLRERAAAVAWPALAEVLKGGHFAFRDLFVARYACGQGEQPASTAREFFPLFFRPFFLLDSVSFFPFFPLFPLFFFFFFFHFSLFRADGERLSLSRGAALSETRVVCLWGLYRRGLDVHRDGSEVSFNLLLSEPHAFTGASLSLFSLPARTTPSRARVCARRKRERAWARATVGGGTFFEREAAVFCAETQGDLLLHAGRRQTLPRANSTSPDQF